MNNRLTFLFEQFFPLFLQLVRFGIVGIIAAVVHFSVVIFLVQNYSLQPLVANIFGFTVGFQVSYWGHRRWTFNGSEVLHRVAIPKLLFVQTLNLAINELIFYFFLTLRLPYPIALFITLAFLPLFTFISNKLWVFK